MATTKKLFAGAALYFAIACAAFFPVLAQAQNGGTTKYYDILASYENGKFSVKSVTLQDGAGAPGTQGSWYYDIVSNLGEVLDRKYFSAPRELCLEAASSSDCVAKNSFETGLSIPYYPSAANINVYDAAGKMALFVNVADMAKLCGDGICQTSENYGTCAQDCRSGIKDNYCDGAKDGVCDPDCGAKKDADCAKQNGVAGAQYNGAVQLIAGILLAVAAIMVFVVLRRKKNRQIQ